MSRNLYGGGNIAHASGLSASILTPIAPVNMSATSNIGAINRGQFCRVVAAKSGTLDSIAVYINTASGNIDVGVYKPGTTMTRLWSSGSIACPAAGGWRVVGTGLNIPVQYGSEFYLAIAADNTTVLFGRTGSYLATQQNLPAGWWDVEGAAGRLICSVNAVMPLPATISYSSVADSGLIYSVIGLII